MVLLKQYVALASLITLGACDAGAKNGPDSAVAEALAPTPLSGNATPPAFTTRDFADLAERDPEFNELIQGAKKFVTQFIKRDISERDIQELATQNPSFKPFMQKTGRLVAQMFKREAPSESPAAGGAVVGIAGDMKAATANPESGTTPEKQATPGGVAIPEKQTVPESGATSEKQLTGSDSATSGKLATPGSNTGPKHHGKHGDKNHGKNHGVQQGKHAHHHSQQASRGKQDTPHAAGGSPQQQLQARTHQRRPRAAADGAQVSTQEAAGQPSMSESGPGGASPPENPQGAQPQGGTGTEDPREASTRKLFEALKKHQSQSKNSRHGRKAAAQPSRSRYGAKHQGLEFQSEPFEMVRFQPRDHTQRPNAQKSHKQSTNPQDSPPVIHETSQKEWAEMQRQKMQAEKERHGEGHMDGQHGMGGTPGGQRGNGATPGRARSRASRSVMYRRSAKFPGNNKAMGSAGMVIGGMVEDGRIGGADVGGMGWGGSGMRGSNSRGMDRSYGGPRTGDIRERYFEERDFEERDFEERGFEERDYKERNFEERDFDERDLEFVYDLLR